MERKRISVRVHPEVMEWLEKQVEKEMSTVSAVVGRALRDYMQATKLIEEMGGEDMVRRALQKQIQKGEEKP